MYSYGKLWDDFVKEETMIESNSINEDEVGDLALVRR